MLLPALMLKSYAMLPWTPRHISNSSCRLLYALAHISEGTPFERLFARTAAGDALLLIL